MIPAVFPAVAALRALAADVRGILGAGCKIGYAADWSEYFGYHPQDGSGDLYFHLDPLWADPNVDFVGIDNYMPLSDWRDGDDHADADWGAIWNLDYLKANVEGGEGYDWYYASTNAEVLQQRTAITDGEYGEPWVWRYKDIRGWWENAHHERIGGVRQASPTAWVPESKPVWFTEYGCAAVDKGSNQPNKFLDPKSSESSLPKYSDGRRDDLIQMQYVRAIGDYWSEPANNPISGVYGGSMIDMGRAHVWAWDARPYPVFPANTALWSDGGNYAKGHWLTGRVTARSLAPVVAEVCEAAGVAAYDVSGLYGIVRGYVVEDVSTGRAALQPLMLAHGFDAVERDGVLRFSNRDGRVDGVVDADRLAVSSDLGAARDHTRSAAPETAGRLRLNFVASDGSFEARTAEAIFPDQATTSVAQSELPLALTHVEARAIVERWLAEARIARDAVQFALPPSGLAHGVGDVVSFNDGDLWRIDRVQDGGARLVEATRVEPGLYQPSDSVEPAARLTPFVPAVPVFTVFLDLPLLTGDEVAHAPHLAVTATPWPGSVAAYASDAGGAFALNRIVPGPSVIGVTETVLPGATAGFLDRGAALRIKVYGGTLASVTDAQLLAGANALAIGDGASDHWEVLQFRDAVLVGEDTWEVSARLRGQRGTDALIPDTWPIGSIVVLLNGAMAQLDLPAAARGLARTWRVGPAARPVDDASYVEEVRAFDGIGLRPYAPSHLRAVENGGDLTLSWVRRTRIDGDIWGAADVPLGEASEAYLLRVLDGASAVRDATLTAPSWSYTAAMQAADAIGGSYGIEVAQISDRFGPGLFRRIEING